MTRREAIRVIGGGAALLGLGAVSGARASAAAAAVPAGAGSTKQPFELPKLGYAFSALEPHVDALTMEIHYSKHHAAYISNANKALQGRAELAGMTAEEILAGLDSIEEPLRTTLRNNVGGHVNHSLWWRIIAPRGGREPSGELADALNRQFGSFDAFKDEFAGAAMKRFGSGWAWLSVKGGKLAVHSSANQDSPLAEGAVPVVGIDVWEHAYYLKHQNRRADYVAAFWRVLDWNEAQRNYAAALGA